jgi:hypothetical protein
MTAANSLCTSAPAACVYRTAAEGHCPTILSEIYRENVNIAIWRRALAPQVQDVVGHFVESHGSFRAAISTTPSRALDAVSTLLGEAGESGAISNDVAELVDMFCCLFDLGEVGLRLGVVDHAMCPKFHVDRVPCRLVTTYQGVGTEWLPHPVVDRVQPAPGTPGFDTFQLGVGKSKESIRQLACADVGLLKGTLWEGNERAGLVHRSPALQPGDRRLVLTLDFLG